MKAADAGVSVKCAVGAMALETTVVFGPRVYDLFHSMTISAVLPLLVTGPLLLINAYFNPGGAAEAGMQRRDAWLRRVAGRRGLLVPSLVGESAEVDAASASALRRASEVSVIEAAEQHLEQVSAVAWHLGDPAHDRVER